MDGLVSYEPGQGGKFVEFWGALIHTPPQH